MPVVPAQRVMGMRQREHPIVERVDVAVEVVMAATRKIDKREHRAERVLHTMLQFMHQYVRALLGGASFGHVLYRTDQTDGCAILETAVCPCVDPAHRPAAARKDAEFNVHMAVASGIEHGPVVPVVIVAIVRMNLRGGLFKGHLFIPAPPPVLPHASIPEGLVVLWFVLEDANPRRAQGGGHATLVIVRDILDLIEIHERAIQAKAPLKGTAKSCAPDEGTAASGHGNRLVNARAGRFRLP
jgi:hypothetical protein